MQTQFDEFEFEYTKFTKTSRVVDFARKQLDYEQPYQPLNRLLYGKELSEYADIPIDELLSQLTEEEIEELTDAVDPDDPLVPPSMRCKEQTKKGPTGPLDRQKLLSFLKQFAMEQEDWPENKPFEAGTKRGKIYVPMPTPQAAVEDMKIVLDLDEEQTLSSASDSDLVDLAGILGLHSMLNQDQYHAAVTNKGQMGDTKFESVVRATVPRTSVAMLPDNDTDPFRTSRQVIENDPSLRQLNWNNIKHIHRDVFKQMLHGLKSNTHLHTLCLSNTGITDGLAAKLIEALKDNKSLSVVNLESNFISGAMIRDMMKAINENQSVTEFRVCNQRPQVMGNRLEMELAKLVEANDTLLQLGLNLDVPDARLRVANKLQSNKDSIRLRRIEFLR